MSQKMSEKSPISNNHPHDGTISLFMMMNGAAVVDVVVVYVVAVVVITSKEKMPFPFIAQIYNPPLTAASTHSWLKKASLLFYVSFVSGSQPSV